MKLAVVSFGWSLLETRWTPVEAYYGTVARAWELAAGGLVAWLMDNGIDESDAHVFAEGLKRGGTLVTAHVPDERAVAAEAIFLKHGVDIAARRNDLAAEGWTRFDDHVPSHLNIEDGAAGEK